VSWKQTLGAQVSFHGRASVPGVALGTGVSAPPLHYNKSSAILLAGIKNQGIPL